MQKRRFRYTKHTADAAFTAYGSTFEEAMENSALALLNMMIDQKKVKKLSGKSVELLISDSARNEDDLVWHVLQDILSLVDARKLNAQSFRVTRLSQGTQLLLEGRLSYKAGEEDCALMSVKAVTPHGLEVKKSGHGYSIKVVVDV